MLHLCFFKAGGEADVAWFLDANFKHNRQLQAFGYVLGFFAVAHFGML
jgi:predicted alpha/beta-fold hydrolase